MRLLIVLIIGFLIFADSPEANAQGRSSSDARKPTSRIPKGDGKVEWGPVAKVNKATSDNVRTIAGKIDRLMDADYQKHNVLPNPRLSDSLFVRRAYLEIGGRIPLLKEVGEFVQSKAPDKREKLIDDLLSSYD